jgi:ATP-dependent Zn protease
MPTAIVRVNGTPYQIKIIDAISHNSYYCEFNKLYTLFGRASVFKLCKTKQTNRDIAHSKQDAIKWIVKMAHEEAEKNMVSASDVLNEALEALYEDEEIDFSQ